MQFFFFFEMVVACGVIVTQWFRNQLMPIVTKRHAGKRKAIERDSSFYHYTTAVAGLRFA